MSGAQIPAEALIDGTDADKFLSLATMPPAQYDRLRESIAASMGIRVATLDVEVSRLRRQTNKSKALALSDPEPWLERVAGDELLNSIDREIATYVVTAEENRTAIVLWILMTYAVESLFILPLLLITSPQKRCGKSTLLILLNKLCRKPLLASNTSSAALFRIVEAYKPTLLLDEADTWARENEELRGIINAGHTRDTAKVIRVDGDQLEPRAFDTFCPKVLAGIGSLTDTINDRALIIQMRRRGANEVVKPVRQDRLNLDHLRSLARRWADDHLSAIGEADPVVPPELHDRAADNWRPLLSIADLVGEPWGKRARGAAVALTPNDVDDDDIRAQLLADIRHIFTERGEDQMPSADLVQLLGGLEARPWSEWKNGRSISAVQLSRLLRPFGVSTYNVRDGGRVYKAYNRCSFEDAFTRYLKSGDSSATALRGPDLQQERRDLPATQHLQVAARPATAAFGVAAQNGANAVENWAGSGVAALKPETGVLEI